MMKSLRKTLGDCCLALVLALSVVPALAQKSEPLPDTMA